MKSELWLLRRDLLMTRQKGNISSSLLHMLRGVNGYAEKTIQEAYLNHLKCDIADLYVQCEKLIEDLDFNVHEIRELGTNRYKESKEQFRKRNLIEYWI